MPTEAETAALVLAAALAGDLPTLERLVQPSGCTDTLPGGYPVTPLMAAAAAGHEKAIALLLRCGCDAAQRDPHGRTAAFYARRSGHHHLAERLDTVVDKEKTIW